MAQDRQAERERAEHLDGAVNPSGAEPLGEEHRQLERRRRARVRRAEDADHQSPPSEGLDRRPGAVSLGHVVDVDGPLAEARDPVRIPLGAERDDERVGVPLSPVHLRRQLGRTDRPDRPRHHPDAPVGQERTRIRPAILRALTIAAATVVALGGAVLAAPSNGDELLKDETHRLEQANKTFSGPNKAGSARNIEVVAHHELGGRGFNADVWTHDGFAYVGHWGFTDWATGNDRFCPSGANNGVAVVDATDAENPVMVSRLQNPAGTSAEDVVVYTAESRPFKGRDIAVAGIQVCGGSRSDLSFPRGLQLWDVTDPANPEELGFWDSECCTRGVHEFEVAYRPDLRRTFAYATVPTSRYPDEATPSGVRDADGEGDFRLIDITNPTAPFQVSDWGIQDIDGPFYDGQGCDPDANYGHGAEPSADGKLVYLSYWDSGFIRLDVTSPGSPVFTGRTVYPANADGDAHSSQWDERRQLLFTADEDFCKASGSGIEKGFGYMRIYDYSNPSAPRQIGAYRTPNSSGTKDPAAGDFTIHNNFLVGTDVYSAWYTDGVRVVDTSNPARPVEVAYFVPPATSNPVKPSQRGVLSNTTQVWGVVVDEDTGLIYASDMNSGLWILRRTITDP